MSVAIFTDISDRDQVVEILNYYQERQKCNGLECPEDNFSEVLEKLIDEIDLLFTDAVEDTDAGGIMNSIVSLVLLMSIDEQAKLVDKLCEKFQSKFQCGDKKFRMKHEALNTLFFGINSNELKFKCFVARLNEELNSDKKHLVNVKLAEVSRWTKEWGISPEDSQSILRKLYKIFQSRENKRLSTETMMMLLRSFNEETAFNAKDDAIECILTAIQDPSNLTLDELLDLYPVQCLQSEPLYELLRIFVNGSIQDYKRFITQNESKLKIYNLNPEACLTKIRVLSLMQMAACRETTVLEYCVLEKELELDDEELESFIIEAVRQKAVACKLDQANRRVLIDGAVPRIFGKEEWERLAADLLMWQDHMFNVAFKLEDMQKDERL